MRRRYNNRPCKYKALITLHPRHAGTAPPRLAVTNRAIVRAEDYQTHQSHFFSALLSTEDGSPPRPGDHDLSMTMVVVSEEDAPRYLEPGEHFSLWLGQDNGHGVVCRRVFI